MTAFAASLPGPVRAIYEAGPTGFVLARRLGAAGIECVVCAPGLIPRGATDRVKADRRDAERLVRWLVAGELHRVVVPSVEEEALRDLVRAREDLRGDLMVRAVPDGCTDVVWQQGEVTTVSGPDTTAKLVDRRAGDLVIGLLLLLPGAGGGVLGVPLDGLRDLGADVAEVDAAFDLSGDLAASDVVPRLPGRG